MLVGLDGCSPPTSRVRVSPDTRTSSSGNRASSRRSRTYKLSLFLPMHVNSDEGKAKWDARKESLVVTLPIVRDEW